MAQAFRLRYSGEIIFVVLQRGAVEPGKKKLTKRRSDTTQFPVYTSIKMGVRKKSTVNYIRPPKKDKSYIALIQRIFFPKLHVKCYLKTGKETVRSVPLFRTLSIPIFP